jgi:hypothetical protein
MESKPLQSDAHRGNLCFNISRQKGALPYLPVSDVPVGRDCQVLGLLLSKPDEGGSQHVHTWEKKIGMRIRLEPVGRRLKEESSSRGIMDSQLP